MKILFLSFFWGWYISDSLSFLYILFFQSCTVLTFEASYI
jgi:hypothetical protein